jgi:hypothetical protein
VGDRACVLSLLACSACGFPKPAPYVDDAAEGSAAAHVFTDPTNWAAFDTSVLPGGPQGFVGAAYDGTNIYFAPYRMSGSPDGVAVAYSAAGSFTDTASWTSFDLTTLDPNAQGFYGALFDSGGIELVPFSSSLAMRYSGTLLADFAQAASWTPFDTTTVLGTGHGYLGGAYDGRYVYYANATEGNHHDGNILRYDTTHSFDDAAGWAMFDYATQAPDPDAIGFAGAISANGKIYFVPFHNDSTSHNSDELLEYDTSMPFTNVLSYVTVKIPDQVSNNAAVAFGGGAFDGKYIYLVPTDATLGNNVVRYDTSMPIANPMSWEAFTAATLSGFGSSDSFFGAAFDGRYVYCLPYASTKLLRYDTTTKFGSASSWQVLDLTAVTSTVGVGGYQSAVYDGEYLYLVPDPGHSIALRFDATDRQTLSNIYLGFQGSFL